MSIHIQVYDERGIVIAYRMLSPITDRLFLSRSALNGTIPSATGRLTSLIQLNLEQQNLTGTIPTELLLLTALSKNGLFLCELIALVALTHL